ncbi:MAG: hypothetical protein PHU63_00055 [Candidatus ainarchaeum sp.]|nr:hypothetical protein [Candidatus ainarchaeum sp.]
MASKKEKETVEEMPCCSGNSINPLFIVGVLALLIGFGFGWVVKPDTTENGEDVFTPDQTKVNKVKTLMEKLYLASFGSKETASVNSVEKEEIIVHNITVGVQNLKVYTTTDYETLMLISEIPFVEYEAEIDAYLKEIGLYDPVNDSGGSEENECVNGVDGTVTDLSGKTVVMYFFWGDGCPHCSNEKVLLRELESKHPELLIKSCEVWKNQNNAQFFNVMATAYGKTAGGVPMTFLDEETWVGYSYDSVGKALEDKIALCLEGGNSCIDPISKLN